MYATSDSLDMTAPAWYLVPGTEVLSASFLGKFWDCYTGMNVCTVLYVSGKNPDTTVINLTTTN